MFGSRLVWGIALGALVVVAAVAVPVSAMFWGHTPLSPFARNNSPAAPANPTTYAASFTETGLPSGTEWSVAIFGAWNTSAPGSGAAPALAAAWQHGLSNESNTSTVGFALANGTYSFSVHQVITSTALFVPSPSIGKLTVNGSAVSVAVTFTAVSLFEVSFVETGLPAGTNWSVGLYPAWPTPTPLSPATGGASPACHGGSQNSSTGTTVNFTVPNGNYSYFVGNVSSPKGIYVPSPAAGNVTINGAGATVDIAFALVPYYTVTFVESGLPSGTNWSVSLFEGWSGGFGGNGSWAPQPLCGRSQFNSSTTSTVDFTLPNGTYAFAVGNASNATDLFVPSPAFGNVTVNGSAVTVDITFSAIPVYEVSFVETGLPSGTNWSVVLFNESSGWFWNGSANATINFTVPNGVYNFSVSNASNASVLYVPSPANGTVTVNGKAVTVDVKFTGIALYTISFVESGLPSGSFWSVLLLNGSAGWAWNGSTNTTVNFTVENGSYPFSVFGGWNSSHLYVPSPARGTVTVDGSDVTVAITFAVLVTYPLAFVESGLPSGTSWYVALESAGSWTFGESNNSSLSFSVVNGTYGFSIGPVWAGDVAYAASPSYGTVTVAGSAVTVDVTFTAL